MVQSKELEKKNESEHTLGNSNMSHGMMSLEEFVNEGIQGVRNRITQKSNLSTVKVAVLSVIFLSNCVMLFDGKMISKRVR